MNSSFQQIVSLIIQGHFATIIYRGQPLTDQEINTFCYMIEHQDAEQFTIPELNRCLELKSFDSEPVSHLLAQLSSSSINITAPGRQQHIELVSRYSVNPPVVKCQFPASLIELITTGDISHQPT